MGSPPSTASPTCTRSSTEADCQGVLALLYHLRVMLQEIAGLPTR